MRGKRIIIWPIYFDSIYSISEGRKLPKQLALKNVMVEEVYNASIELGLKSELKMDTAHPSHPWMKGGMVLVEKSDSKRKMLIKIAEKMRAARESKRTHEKNNSYK